MQRWKKLSFPESLSARKDWSGCCRLSVMSVFYEPDLLFSMLHFLHLLFLCLILGSVLLFSLCLQFLLRLNVVTLIPPRWYLSWLSSLFLLPVQLHIPKGRGNIGDSSQDRSGSREAAGQKHDVQHGAVRHAAAQQPVTTGLLHRGTEAASLCGGTLCFILSKMVKNPSRISQ